MFQSTATSVAKINNINILVFEDGDNMVPIKPICEAVGVDFSSQLQKLKSDPILNSTMVLSTTVGADGKNREMVCLPFRYVFGWLFKIDARNVAPDAQEGVIKYQKICYDALYEWFVLQNKFAKWKEELIMQRSELEERLLEERKILNEKIKDAANLKQEAIFYQYNRWVFENQQTSLEFPAEASQAEVLPDIN
jgi:hypothetical protein